VYVVQLLKPTFGKSRLPKKPEDGTSCKCIAKLAGWNDLLKDNFQKRAAWIRMHCFDVECNYLFHRDCILESFPGIIAFACILCLLTCAVTTGISKSTLSRGRKGIVTVRLKGWEHLRLYGPSRGVLQYFSSLQTHGLINQQSNRSKALQISKRFFVAFVKQNRIPTGRTKGKLFRLSSDFTCIKSPSSEEATEEQCSRSLEYQFNLTLKALIEHEVADGLALISGSTVLRWWNAIFARNTEISPHPTDYCDTCAVLVADMISVKQKITLQKVLRAI
jgi:hypothetical protein